MELRRRALQGVRWSLLHQWGKEGLSLVVLLILIRMLGPAEFGLMAIANVFIALGMVVIQQGFNDAIVQRKELELEHLDTAFWTNLMLGGMAALVVVLLAKPAADWFSQPVLGEMLPVLSCMLLIGSLRGVQAAILRRRLDFRRIATVFVTGAFLGGVVGVGMAFQGFGVWSLVAQGIVSSSTEVVLLWWSSDWRPRLRYSLRHLKDLWSFGIHVFGVSLLGEATARVDALLIGAFLGARVTGLYSVGRRCVQSINRMLANAAGQVAFPTFSKMQGDASRMGNAYYTGIQMLSFVAFPVFVSVGLLSEEIVISVFGPQWSEGAVVLGILAIGGMIGVVARFNHTVMLANGKSSWRLVLGLANVVSRIAAFFLVWRWGIAAIAAAFVAVAFIFACVGFQISRHLIGVKASFTWRHLYPQLVSALVMGVGIAGVRMTLGDAIPGLVVIGIAVTIGLILYAVSSWVMSPALVRRAWELGRLALPTK